MQKILRIHLGNCGYRTAWYEGTTFDLTDPETGLPTDTIINLENGGGKTTLLGLIFSCFETSQERFLKHLQSRHNSFSQYFTHDGVPGFIIVEWLMPPRVAGSPPYRLITGQAVSVRTTTDPPDVDRTFFSFEERADLGFKDIPAPGLCEAPSGSMADFSRWIHDQQKKHAGNVYINRNRQAEWQRHVKDECLIDLDMLRMQVNFSAQEGGFDTGFLDFRTEGEFLRKFLHLTSDTVKAEEARKLVVTVCEKHRRKPQMQRRRDELKKFRTSLNAFAEAAQQYLDALASQRTLLIQGAQLVQALQVRATAFREAHKQEVAFETEQRTQAGAAAGDSFLFTKELVTATWAWHQKRTALAKVRRDNGNQAVSDREREDKLIRAARLQKEILGINEQVKELEGLAEAERENLKPARDHVHIQGALLRRALFNEETRLNADLEALTKRATERELSRSAHKAQKLLAETDELQLSQEQSRLQAAEEQYTKKRQSLESDGTLLAPEEATDEAIVRLETLSKTLVAERDALRIARDSSRTQAKRHRASASAERVKATSSSEQAKALSVYLARAEAEFERLAQLPSLLSAVESDRVDPMSPVLLPRLQQVVVDSARQMSIADVRLAELRATKQAIEETGVAGYSPDVAFVVQTLLHTGVRSAKAFNEYISRAVPNASRARALVLSDPARYTGVCVAQTEFEKANAVTWTSRRPGRPVMISIASLDAASAQDDRIVVAPEDDSAFNVEAATHLGVTLASRVAAEEQRRAAYETRHTQTLKAAQELETYAKEFGDGQLSEASVKKLAFEEDTAMATGRAEHLEIAATELDEKAEGFEQQANAADLRNNAAAQSAKSVRLFQTEHEEGRPGRVERLVALVTAISDAQVRKAAADKALDLVQEAHDADQQKRVSSQHELGMAGQERARITYYDRDYPAHEQLLQNPRPLETLRRIYKDAEDNYLTEEKSRLGMLSERIQSTQRLRTGKAEEFTRDFRGVQMNDLRPYLEVNHEEALDKVAEVLKGAKSEQVQATSHFEIVSGESRTWHNSNKVNIGPAVASHEALEIDALAGLIAEVDAKVKSALDRMRQANEEATKASDRASAKLRSAEQDDQTESLLRGGMGFPEKPDPALIAAEIGALVGTTPEIPDAAAIVLELNPAPQGTKLLTEYNSKNKGVGKLQSLARTSFDTLKSAAAENTFREVDPDVSQQMLQNDFNSACTDALRLLEHLDDRIATTESTLASMQGDFDTCIEEVLGVVRAAIATLNRAASHDKCVPAAAPYVGGKQVLKMRANFSTVTLDMRRMAMRNYLDMLAETNAMPARGTDLIADAVVRVYGKPLGFQVLKMSIEETEQYVPVEKISNSGGEGVVMAMFLYLVINQLRAENHAQVQRNAGGPLILDNPFAKATSPAMWRAQRLLASAMNVQLIFATALQDYNAIGEFQRFIRLRKAGQNTKTKRWHIEIASFKLNETPDEVAA